MTKSDLVAFVAERTGNSQQVTKEVIDATISAIKHYSGAGITIVNFGRFERSKQVYKNNLKKGSNSKVDVEKLVFRSKVRY